MYSHKVLPSLILILLGATIWLFSIGYSGLRDFHSYSNFLLLPMTLGVMLYLVGGLWLKKLVSDSIKIKDMQNRNEQHLMLRQLSYIQWVFITSSVIFFIMGLMLNW